MLLLDSLKILFIRDQLLDQQSFSTYQDLTYTVEFQFELFVKFVNYLLKFDKVLFPSFGDSACNVNLSIGDFMTCSLESNRLGFSLKRVLKISLEDVFMLGSRLVKFWLRTKTDSSLKVMTGWSRIIPIFHKTRLQSFQHFLDIVDLLGSPKHAWELVQLRSNVEDERAQRAVLFTCSQQCRSKMDSGSLANCLEV